MPAKYRVKEYEEGGVYHIYNRGIEGREVFGEEKDYLHFEELMRRYSLEGEVEIIAYCLLPDHWHVVVKQASREGMTKWVRRVMTAYVMYFNRSRGRKGPLFENVYRAVRVDPPLREATSGERWQKLLYLTKYLHLHPVARTVRRWGPVETVTTSRPDDYKFSSYLQYIGINNKKWINCNLLKMRPEEYKEFTQDARKMAGEVLEGLTFD